MVPEKRRTVPVQQLTYSHTMKFEKTKKWKDHKMKTESNKMRKRKERLEKKNKKVNKKNKK